MQESQETQIRSLGWEDTLREEMQPTLVFLPGEFNGQRSLAGYSPWGCKESDTTERLTLDMPDLKDTRVLVGRGLRAVSRPLWCSLDQQSHAVLAEVHVEDAESARLHMVKSCCLHGTASPHLPTFLPS